MKKYFYFLLLVAMGCQTTEKVTTSDDGQIDIILLQMNDIYEISPLEKGTLGGMARVATLRKALLRENPNTLTVLSGDFLNPSPYGALKYEGEGIRGRQMVETMNALGVDWVTFGNHEFDLKESDLQKRLNESKFGWVCNNTIHVEGGARALFSRTGSTPFSRDTVLVLRDADGTALRLGMFGTCITSTVKDYVAYDDPITASQQSVQRLTPKSDVVIGITHLAISDDLKLAAQNPTVALLMGGHEHAHDIHQVGKVTVAKADANAKTVYVHRIKYNTSTKKCTVKSELVAINDGLAEDEAVAKIVTKWKDIAYTSMRAAGIEPDEVIAQVTVPLEGREDQNRSTQTNLGQMINKAYVAAAKKPIDCAFFNSGSIRIDDVLAGQISQYDVVRLLPFGGGLTEVDIKGSMMLRVLAAHLENKGTGGYLQLHNITFDEKQSMWLINGKKIDPNTDYHIITGDFLLTGGEKGMSFFKDGAEGISNIVRTPIENIKDLRSNCQLAVVAYLKGKR